VDQVGQTQVALAVIQYWDQFLQLAEVAGIHTFQAQPHLVVDRVQVEI